jgi:oligopeptide/dipeptide ABC transporter ATP-binding protein
VELAPTQELFSAPRHPYAKALIGSLPDPDLEVEWLTTIPGQPPSLYDLPPGCPFAPRCADAMDICREQYPPTFETGDVTRATTGARTGAGQAQSPLTTSLSNRSHTAACWLYGEAAK